MTDSVQIAIDAMGGDLGVDATVPAVLALSSQYPEVHFQLYGEASACSPLLATSLSDNIDFFASGDSVSMADSPAHALRHKRESSMAMALNAVAQNTATACISAGNTGALVAMASHCLKMQPGIDRPALCQALPAANGHSYLLDLGANTDCSAEQLRQFAYLGSALSRTVDHVLSPSVRLLNIGSEDYKGTAAVQQVVDSLLQADDINYQGFIEGDQLYQGLADVIVCDGFAGNVALKASEGVSRFMTLHLKKIFGESLYGRCMAFLAKPLFVRWQQAMNPDRYNGAYLLGLNGMVVKSHGGVAHQQFAYALTMLIHQCQQHPLSFSNNTNDSIN